MLCLRGEGGESMLFGDRGVDLGGLRKMMRCDLAGKTSLLRMVFGLWAEE